MAYIDVGKLLKELTTSPDGTKIPDVDCDNFPVKIDLRLLKRIILRQPTAEVAEVKHGHWIPTDIEQEFFGCIDEATIYKCSLCGRYEDKQEPYCHCGARMDGDK